tara:strand:- start:219 stop:569 length:351 start_codon:yes stop_codon:yes gene_type:complete
MMTRLDGIQFGKGKKPKGLENYEIKMHYRGIIREAVDEFTEKKDLSVRVVLGQSGSVNAGVFLRKKGVDGYYRFQAEKSALKIYMMQGCEEIMDDVNRFNQILLNKLGLTGKITEK